MPGEHNDGAPSDSESIALSMGWKPKDQFRGDESKWVDAKTFVERGEHFIPILQKNNRQLREQNEALARQQEEMQGALAAAQEAIEALKENTTAMSKRAAEEARKDLVAKLKEARDNNDVEAEAEIFSQLTDVTNAQAAAGVKPPAPPPPPAPTKPVADPAFLEWQADNPWFTTDSRRRALATAIAGELRSDPRNAKLIGRPFFDEVTRQVEEVFEPPRRAGAPKVGGGKGGNGGNGGGSGAKGYDQLPDEAKEACAKLAGRVVGNGRAHKNIESWQAAYASQYWSLEA
jgi:hypothetical protein